MFRFTIIEIYDNSFDIMLGECSPDGHLYFSNLFVDGNRPLFWRIRQLASIMAWIIYAFDFRERLTRHRALSMRVVWVYSFQHFVHTTMLTIISVFISFCAVYFYLFIIEGTYFNN